MLKPPFSIDFNSASGAVVALALAGRLAVRPAQLACLLALLRLGGLATSTNVNLRTLT